eukprot:9474616-Pyramimonas_sp.AAC.1
MRYSTRPRCGDTSVLVTSQTPEARYSKRHLGGLPLGDGGPDRGFAGGPELLNQQLLHVGVQLSQGHLPSGGPAKGKRTRLNKSE